MNSRHVARFFTAFMGSAVASIVGAAPGDATNATCRARSDVQTPAVVELYTSEGCSSCPPADRWASALKGRRDVLVLAFHVNYWDKLGWRDRFASAANTERQHLLQRTMGAAYVYTPQVVHNGHDLRAWSRASLTPLGASPIALSLERDGNAVHARVTAVPSSIAAPDGPQRVAGYWAVLEDGHRSRVKSGENAGETLAHDHVVTRYQALGPWPTAQPQRFTLDLAPAVDASAPPRRVAFIVTDAQGAKPLQALVLDC